jgi:Holliday junction resolvase-like predicted endonuclease
VLLSIEINLLISLLKLTENGSVKQETVNKYARLPASLASKLLEKLQNENLVYLKDSSIEVDTESRLKIAVKAVELGADIQSISDFLRWQEFEAIAAVALELNGYATKKNVRFKHGSRRWEIDVVGCRKPLVLCIDCKHWHHGMHPSTLTKMAASQAERVAAFADSLPKKTLDLPCVKWSKAKFIPVILSLIPFSPKFCGQVPIVPVLQLQDFVSQLPLNVELLKYFSREFSHL